MYVLIVTMFQVLSISQFNNNKTRVDKQTGKIIGRIPVTRSYILAKTNRPTYPILDGMQAINDSS